MSQRTDSSRSQTLTGLALLTDIVKGMPITADLSRSDLLLVCPQEADRLVVTAQARPHSTSSLYTTELVGQTIQAEDAPVIMEAWRRGSFRRVQREVPRIGSAVMQSVHPIRGPDGNVVALLSIETSLIQVERHRHRHIAFRRAIEWLQQMCLRGELARTEHLSPFGEWDGVMFVDMQRRIIYMSGIANNLYRRLGYLEDLRGRRLSFLNTADDALVAQAISTRQPLEQETEEAGHIWIRKVLPVWPPPTRIGDWLRHRVWHPKPTSEIGGVLVMLHDATEERRKRQELKVKTTMIQEVHHRVKNNLQAIAAMLRMQARRTQDTNARHVLNEAIARILSVAVIHEFLSLEEAQTINIRDVCSRIIMQNQQVLMAPGKRITFAVEGPNIYLPSQQATTCALVINELIHNALEHGFEQTRQGAIRVTLTDGGDRVGLEIWDDGDRLPADFDLANPSSLGLQIVRTLVQDDLRGTLRLENKADGVVANIEFPKMTL